MYLRHYMMEKLVKCILYTSKYKFERFSVVVAVVVVVVVVPHSTYSLYN